MGASHRQQQHRIRGDLEGGNRFHGIGVAHLRLAHAQQNFLLPEVDFDVPAPDVALEQSNYVGMRIGANQKGGFTVKKLGALAEPISQRGNHHELQSVLQAGRTPQQGRQSLTFIQCLAPEREMEISCQGMDSSVRICSGVGAGAP